MKPPAHPPKETHMLTGQHLIARLWLAVLKRKAGRVLVLSGKHVSLLWRMNRGFHTPEPPWDI